MTARLKNAALNQRISARQVVAIKAILRMHSTIKVPVMVEDLSHTGFRCECIYQMQHGMLIWLTLPKMAGLQAEVIRNNGWMFGFKFVRDLHPAIFDHVAAKYAVRF